MKNQTIDPRKAVPQAPLALRAGDKPNPDDAPDSKKPNDGDEDEHEEGDEQGASLEAHDANRAAAVSAMEAACTAFKAGSGSDSASGLRAEEEASSAAREACSIAEGSSMKLRGATPDDAEPAPAKRPGAPPALAPAPSARAIARAAGGSATAALEVTAMVGLARFVMSELGEPDPVRARGAAAARFQIAGRAERSAASEAAAVAESATVRRERLWEQAVLDGRFRSGQVFSQAEGPLDAQGKATRVRAFSTYAAQMNALHPELPALEAFLARFPRLARGDGEQASEVLTEAGDQRRGARELTEADRASAARAGVPPDLLARALAAKGRTPIDDHQRA